VVSSLPEQREQLKKYENIFCIYFKLWVI